MATSKAATRTIVIFLANGRRTLVEGIPANAKITFGKLQPGERNYGGDNNALRIYTTANNQLAVFTGVASFRDLSLTVKEQKVTKKLKTNAVVGPNGHVGDDQYEESFTWEEVAVA